MEHVFQTAYGEKVRPQTSIKEKSLTKQSLADEANINKIVKRHLKTGTLADLNKVEGIYGEITAQSLMEAHQQIEAANNAFMEIPSEIRKQFDNDAGKFIDFATNPENLEQMQQWGLARPTKLNDDGTHDLDNNSETLDNPTNIDPNNPPVE